MTEFKTTVPNSVLPVRIRLYCFKFGAIVSNSVLLFQIRFCFKFRLFQIRFYCFKFGSVSNSVLFQIRFYCFKQCFHSRKAKFPSPTTEISLFLTKFSSKNLQFSFQFPSKSLQFSFQFSYKDMHFPSILSKICVNKHILCKLWRKFFEEVKNPIN